MILSNDVIFWLVVICAFFFGKFAEKLNNINRQQRKAIERQRRPASKAQQPLYLQNGRHYK